MPIFDNLIKAYRCEHWSSDGTSDYDEHGGGITPSINSSTLIVNGAMNNIFDDVTNAQRQDPTISKEYRKIYIRNENTDSFPGCKAWLSAIGGGGIDSTLADNDTVKILLAGTLSRKGVSIPIPTATGIFITGVAEIVTSSSCVGLVAPGEKVYNGGTGNDAGELANAGTVLSVDESKITLTSGYAGSSSGTGTTILVAPITECYVNFVKPLSKVDALTLGTIPGIGGNSPIWILREVIVAGGPGHSENMFTIMLEMS